MESLTDQRRVPRAPINFPVKISPGVDATITDVSETGIGFDCSGAAAPIEKIPLVTEVSSASMTVSEKVPVKLVWSRDSSGSKYRFGASFYSAVPVSQLLSQLK